MARRYIDDGSGDSPLRVLGNCPCPPEISEDDSSEDDFRYFTKSKSKTELLMMGESSDFAVADTEPPNLSPGFEAAASTAYSTPFSSPEPERLRTDLDVPSSPKYMLTDDILEGFESHFNWIACHDLTQEDMFRFRKKWDKWLEESQDMGLTFCQTVTRSLVDFILDFILENEGGYQKALSDFEEALLAFPEDLPHEYFLAYSYYGLIEKINMFHRLGNATEANRLFAKLMVLDLSSDKTNAVVLVVKSQFLGVLGLSDERRDLLLQVIDLDPEFSEWHGNLFSTLRRIRRERCFLSSPDEDEILACHTSFTLDMFSPQTLSRMSVLYEDILKANHRNGAPNELLKKLGRVEMSRQMISFARSACEQRPNNIEFNVRLAEMLANGSIGKELVDLEGSEEQFNRCLKKWPNSSHVLHKMGKFYIWAKSDWERGIDYFKQSLCADFNNFPCLMDYLRGLFRKTYDTDRLNNEHLKFTELIEILDTEIPLFRLKTVLCSKLKAMKAALLWKLGRQDEAVDLWLDALLKDQNLDNEGILNIMGGGTVFKSLLTAKDFQNVLELMNARKQKETDSSESDEDQPIQNFVTAFEKDFEKWDLAGKGRGGNRNRGWRQASDQPEKENHRLRYVSEGGLDSDSDWRSQCSSSGFSSAASTASDISCTGTNPRPYSDRNELRQRGRQETDYMYRDPSVPFQSHSNNGYNNDSKVSFARDRRDSTLSSSSYSSTEPSRNYNSYQRQYNTRRQQPLSVSDIDDNWRRHD